MSHLDKFLSPSRFSKSHFLFYGPRDWSTLKGVAPPLRGSRLSKGNYTRPASGNLKQAYIPNSCMAASKSFEKLSLNVWHLHMHNTKQHLYNTHNRNKNNSNNSQSSSTHTHTQKHTHTNTETKQQGNKEASKQTETHTHTHTFEQTSKQTERQTHPHTHTHTQTQAGIYKDTVISSISIKGHRFVYGPLQFSILIKGHRFFLSLNQWRFVLFFLNGLLQSSISIKGHCFFMDCFNAQSQSKDTVFLLACSNHQPQ